VTADGLVTSEVTLRERKLPDLNGFVTALAARALRQAGVEVPGAMLDALERCRSPAGGFRFWPAGLRPAWAPDLPDDTDDTALMTLELFLAGRMTLTEARRTACMTIGRHRIAFFERAGPPWRRVGVFRTWHRAGSREDLVDCVATVNALGLFASLDLPRMPGSAEATEMLEAAIVWAGNDRERAASLSPFYPDPAELVLALAHAVARGAKWLGPLYATTAAASWGRDAAVRVGRADHPLCSNPYGNTVWRAPALAALRRQRGKNLCATIDPA
jgi:hypothetical protein